MIRFVKSVKYAARGIVHAIQREHNFRLQLLVAICVVLFGLRVSLDTYEWIAILFLILLVLILELLNTIVEHFIDLMVPRFSTQVQVVKDLLAAMVLLASLGAAVIGLIIFVPHLIELLA